MNHEQQKESLKSRLENFWYYHKITVIFVFIILALVCMWSISLLNTIESDLRISIITTEAVTKETIRINDAFSPIMQDIDKDGGTYITTAQLPISEDLSDKQSETYIGLLESQLANREAILFIADAVNLERLIKKDAFCPLDAFFDVTVYGDRVFYRDGVPIAFHLSGSKALSDLGFINDDLYALLLFQIPEEENDPIIQAEYQNAMRVITELMK